MTIINKCVTVSTHNPKEQKSLNSNTILFHPMLFMCVAGIVDGTPGTLCGSKTPDSDMTRIMLLDGLNNEQEKRKTPLFNDTEIHIMFVRKVDGKNWDKLDNGDILEREDSSVSST